MELRPLVPRDPNSPRVPVVGMGTSGTFDTDDTALVDRVVSAAIEHGSNLFDSSPMYGQAERILGEVLAERRPLTTIATKVWTPDDDEAIAQLDASVGFYGGHVDVMQVHNMVAWPTRLDQIEARREADDIAYVGATHWQVEGFGELEAAMETGRVDVVQVPYNPCERVVEERILPLAADRGIGVLVMRPFARAELLASPPAASELERLAPTGATTWGQVLLAWCLGHPAITAAIPATSKPERAVENAAAGELAPLDADTREQVAALFTS